MTTTKPITAAKLWIVLARAHASVASYMQHAIAAQGLCLTDFMVLEVLLHKGPLTISAIGEKVLLASASMTSAIDRVEQFGYVQRLTCDKDRRIRYIQLTPTGRDFISALYAEHERDLERLTANLSATERQNLYTGLKNIGLNAKAATLSPQVRPNPDSALASSPQRPNRKPGPASSANKSEHLSAGSTGRRSNAG
jgi:MarR family 2-MHQ and catechol resistance regulon transcriptional repressor